MKEVKLVFYLSELFQAFEGNMTKVSGLKKLISIIREKWKRKKKRGDKGERKAGKKGKK